MRRHRSLADFEIGETFETESRIVDMDEALRFARTYDPQPFHLDAAAAAESLFGRVVVSGWYTAAATMRLIVECGVLREIGIVGTGIDDLRWLAPVEPGASLFVRGEVVGVLHRPDKRRGTLRVQLLTIDGDGVTVMSQIASLVVPERPPEAASVS